MEFKNFADVIGRVKIIEYPKGSYNPETKKWKGEGKVIIDKKNLIVDVGLNRLRDIISGTETTNVTIDDFALGDDNTAVTSSDTALGNEVTEKAFDDTTDGSTGIISYNGVLLSTEPVSQPQDYSEFAAKFGDGVIFNKLVFATSTKEDTVEWRIVYTVTFANG